MRLQRVCQDHPGADGRPEVLGRERTQGNVLPGLNVSGRPVVHQNITEHVLRRIRHGNRRAHLTRLPHQRRDLELDVQALTRREAGGGGPGRRDLAPRPADGRPGHDDGGRAAVVGDGHVLVVGLQRLVRAAEDRADGEGVPEPRVEVGVVADAHGQVQRHARLRQHGPLAERCVVSEEGCSFRVLGEDVAEVQPDRVGHASAECGEAVERFLAEDVEVPVDLWELCEAASCCELLEIYH